MDNKDESIQQFMELTAADNNVAVFYLESAKWELETAISSYFANDNEEREEHEHTVIHNAVTESVGDSGLNNVNVSVAQHMTKSSKPQEKITTLSSIKNADSNEDEEERGQAFYVGGSERGGGQQVLGPPRVNKKKANAAYLHDLFKSAQDHGAEVVTEEFPDSGAVGSSKIFSGTGNRLGDENSTQTPTNRIGSSDSTQGSSHIIKVNVKIWANGFSVDDGPLRSLTEPNDREFLRALTSAEIPTELLQQHKFGKIDLNLEDRTSEDFKAAPKPRFVAFQGSGQMLGSPVPKIISNPTSTPLAKEPMSSIIVDETKPVTQLQIRLADNSRLMVRMNHEHNIGDIRRQIISQRPQYESVNFNLMTTFPNKVLSDDSLSLKEANLLNAVVVQRLI